MRTKNSILNFVTSFFPWVLLAILGFLKIDIFINNYGSELNGLVQLTYQVFNYFGLAEMGFGSAIIYKLYKLFAENNTKKINEVFNGAIKIYKKIGYILFSLGIVFAIYSLLFIKSSEVSSLFTFVLIILNAIDYLLIYRILMPYQTLLIADQKKYRVNLIINTKLILFRIFELILIMLHINYLIVFSVGMVFNLIASLLVRKETIKNYPWISTKSKADLSTFSMTKDVFVHRISKIVFDNTDAILLSLFKGGLTTVSIYASYNYILSYLKEISNYVLNSPLESLGNLFADKKESQEKKISIYDEYFIVSMFISIFFSTMFCTTIKPFIVLWVGNDYILSNITVFLFTSVLFSQCISTTIKSLISATGKFKETKRIVVLASLSNIILSIILVRKYQIAGVLFATAISEIFITMPLNAKYIYNNVLNVSQLSYYLRLLYSIMSTIILIILNKIIIKLFSFTFANYINWALSAIILSIIDLIIIFTTMYILFKPFKNLIARFRRLKR